MTEALRRVRNAREEEDGKYRRHRHRRPRHSPADSEVDFEMVDEEEGRTDSSSRRETGQTFIELEIRGNRLLQNARQSRQERQMVSPGRRKDTQNGTVVTKLRRAGDDQTFAIETEVRSHSSFCRH